MNVYRSNLWVILLILGFIIMGLWGCAGMQNKPTAKLEVIPDEIVRCVVKESDQLLGKEVPPHQFDHARDVVRHQPGIGPDQQ